jgi:hypothetical protein
VGGAALRRVPSAATVAQEGALYAIANAIATTYAGRMSAILEPEGALLYAMRLADWAAILRALTQRVRLTAWRNSPKSLQKSRGQRPAIPKKGHVSTAKLLINRKAQLATP